MNAQKTAVHSLLQLVAVIIGVVGLFLTLGGIYLVTLGGSWYYLIAGGAYLFAAYKLFAGNISGIYLYLLIFTGTIIWAVWEVGFSFWPLVPRVVAPLFVAACVLLCVPLIATSQGRPARPQYHFIAGLVMLAIFLGYIGLMLLPHDVVQKNIATVPGKSSQATIAAGDNWLSWGRTTEGVRYAPFDQINAENVNQLEVAWTARTGFIADQSKHMQDQNTPLYVDGTLFQCAAGSQVTALDATTGRIKWQFNPDAAEGTPFWKRCRSLGYFDPGKNEPCGPRIIVTAMDNSMHAIRTSNGKHCNSFGENGIVNLTAGLGEVNDGFWTPTTGPLVAKDKIILGAWVADNVMVGEPSGAIRAFDARTGKQVWAWDLGNPAISNWPPEGESYTRGTPNSWSGLAADEQLGMVYVPLGNATPDYYGGQRRDFDDEYNATVVALNLDTGREIWKFQTVHHDIWDYDLPSQPALADIPTGDGSFIPGLIQTTKRGQIFVLNRKTGKPIKKVVEKPAPRSDGRVAGEYYAETQPYSTEMHAIGGAELTEKRMWGATPMDHLLCRILYKSYRYEGDFTTQSTRKSIVYPGNNGGMNWGSVTVDQHSNKMIVADMRMPVITHLIPREEFTKAHPDFKGDAHGELSPQFGLPYAHHITNFMSPLGIPCLEPPWGTISAIDLASGELVWQQPAGTSKDVTLPGIGLQNSIPFYIGMPALGGLISTAGGISFHGGTQDYYLRAYDTETGKVLWKGRLPSGAQSTPLTYIGRDGRQYVVTTAGGARYNPNDWADYIVAFALPEK